MIQLDEGGELHMFYVILPESESSRSDQLSRNEFEDDDVLHYDYDD